MLILFNHLEFNERSRRFEFRLFDYFHYSFCSFAKLFGIYSASTISVRMSRPESRDSTEKGGPNFNRFRNPRDVNDSRLASSRSNFSGNDENSDEQLATKAIQIQTKRFNIDVKQNKNGKFIKVAEVSFKIFCVTCLP